MKAYLKNSTFAQKKTKNGFLSIFLQKKEQFPMKWLQGSLDISPEDCNFFLPHHFSSSLKDTIMTSKEYDNVRKFYQILKLKDLGELNKIYNFQDIILCKIFEQHSVIYKNFLYLTLENVILQVS